MLGRAGLIEQKTILQAFVLVFYEETTGRFISTVPVYAERNGSIQAA